MRCPGLDCEGIVGLSGGHTVGGGESLIGLSLSLAFGQPRLGDVWRHCGLGLGARG